MVVLFYPLFVADQNCVTGHLISNRPHSSLLTRKQQALTISELQQGLRLLNIQAFDAFPRRIVYVEPEQICQLEHFFRGELESGMGAPFQCWIHIRQPEFIEEESQKKTMNFSVPGKESLDDNIRPRLIQIPPGFSSRCMLLRKSITLLEMSMKKSVTTASNSPSLGNISKKSPSTSLTVLFGQWSGTVMAE